MAVTGDIVWEHSKDGALGWNTSIVANPSGTYLLVGMDVSGVYIKPNDPAEIWQQVMRPDKIPVGFTAPLGLIQGCYGVDWASDTRAYFAMHDELLRLDMSGADWTVSRTALTGLTVYANSGEGRKYWGKVAADRSNADVCYVVMGAAGLRRTINGGTSFTTPTGVPVPTTDLSTEARHGIVAVDNDSALTSGRRSRIAVCSFGNGIYVSTDGGDTFSAISTTIKATADLQWRNGNLYACGASHTTQHTDGTINVWDGTSWSTKTQPAAFGGVQHLMPLPSGSDDWLLFDYSNFIAKTTDDFTTYQRWIGNFNWSTMRQTRVNPYNPRPMVAKKNRRGVGGSAISRPILVNGDILWPYGYGTLRTALADWPVNESIYFPESFSATNWPTWTEETAGIEELVPLSSAWSGDRLYCLSQDVAIRIWPENGHRHAVNFFPNKLSRGHDIGIASDGSAALKAGDNSTLVADANRCAFAADGVIFEDMTNDPASNSPYAEGGGMLNFGSGQLVHFPTRAATGISIPWPQYTSDAGATAWTRCNIFHSNGTEVNYSAISADTHLNGWQHYGYVNQMHRHCIDPTTGHGYSVNIGGTNTASSWQQTPDPLGLAGLYKMDAAEFGTFRRVHDGHPTPYGNWAYFDTQLIADGQGHLVFQNTPLQHPAAHGFTATYLSSGADNYLKIYDLDANGDVTALRQIPTPYNVAGIAFGAPYTGDTQKALWIVGNHGGVFGLWLIRDLTTLAVEGPFNLNPDNLSVVPSISSLSAHATEFGRLGIGYISMGHAQSSYNPAA